MHRHSNPHSTIEQAQYFFFWIMSESEITSLSQLPVKISDPTVISLEENTFRYVQNQVGPETCIIGDVLKTVIHSISFI